MISLPRVWSSIISFSTSTSELGFLCCLSRALIVLLKVEIFRGRDAPLFFKSDSTSSIAESSPWGAAWFWLAIGVTGLLLVTILGRWAKWEGHWKLPRWFSTMCSFSLIDFEPSRWLSVLQHATQLPSSFVPPFALATKCSIEASPIGSGLLQKKHWPPWANNRRVMWVVIIDKQNGKDSNKHSTETAKRASRSWLGLCFSLAPSLKSNHRAYITI